MNYKIENILEKLNNIKQDLIEALKDEDWNSDYEEDMIESLKLINQIRSKLNYE